MARSPWSCTSRSARSLQAPYGKRNRLRRGATLCIAAGRADAHCDFGEPRADGLVGPLRPDDLVVQARAIEQPKIAVRLGMIADLEQRIGHQLLGALLVRAHPLAAGEEGRLDALAAQRVDDGAVVAGDLARLLAQIERQRYELAPRRQLHAADRTDGIGRRTLGRGDDPTLRRRRIEAAIALAGDSSRRAWRRARPAPSTR